MPIYTPGSSPIVCNGHRLSAVWQNTANGPVIRRKAYNKNFAQIHSTESRARMLTAVGAWRTLSGGQQTAWDTTAPNFIYQDSCGNNYTLSGQQLFFKSAKRLLDRPATINTSTPTVIAVSNPSFNFITINAGTPTFTVNTNPSPVPANNFGKLIATPPLPVGISNPGQSNFFYIREVLPGGGGVYDMLPFYTNLFPFWQSEIGKKIFVLYSLEDDPHGLSVNTALSSIIIA